MINLCISPLHCLHHRCHVQVGCLCAMCYGIHKSLQDTKQVHLAVLIVLAAAVFQLLSVVCELLHLRTYMQDGLGLRWRYTWFPCDFYSEVKQLCPVPL